ncbi:interferon-induced GTP-binding protein Mx1 [Pelodytes ibericus]
MDTMLANQYEEKIRPCIDLIDSLRALGVEKDLGLPAIAVIGDQSSGKSSVLEALSGVTLPRGSGIVTRCPLELRLKKANKDSDWSGQISYGEHVIMISSAAEVEDEVKKAQDCMAGPGNGVSQDLITLEVVSPNVPDLTLIDLPGITRIALPNQPIDIGKQIKQMITKYIRRQQTINLVVVPSNVDIATNEALEMAREVDPTGERTLGILTKPDLVDRGTEPDVVNVVRNQVYNLKKGFMIVKCRGQLEIQDKLTLEDALEREMSFFEEHEHFSCLVKEGYATIPCLAEKLTTELVEHITNNLPNLEDQIKCKLEETAEKLKRLGSAIPDTEQEKMYFLIEKIKQFTSEIINTTKGEEDTTNGTMKLFTDIRRHFYSWELTLKKSSEDVGNKLRVDISSYENQYRGRELTGFVSFKTFESIVRKHIKTFEEPALQKLKDITGIVLTVFNKIAVKQFIGFPNLQRSAKINIEDICQIQQEEAEKTLRTYFKMENVIYCQDTIYGGSLKAVRSKAASTQFIKPGLFVPEKSNMQLSVEEMAEHVEAYLESANNRLANQVPLIIQYYILHEFARHLDTKMTHLIQDPQKLDSMLAERQDLSRLRSNLKEKIERLSAARRRLARFPDVDFPDIPLKMSSPWTNDRHSRKRGQPESGNNRKRKPIHN